ncbi:MAG: LysM peptidoglycan-binding domain-containing protein [Lachnospiraceae bacterium]|nr:LysM peptidoglycan-binding domain-containing protein [Lachnospiraceae bacterium]
MKLPKNFRQIGEAAGLTKIYIEDYVMTYLSAITKDSRTYVRGAILFGEIERVGSETYIFVNGAMEAQNIELDLDETVFDDEVWKKIYETKDQYFPQTQIVGWYLCRTGMSVRLNDKIKKTHFENFPGDGKVLYVRDPLEEEEAMYAYRGQDLVRQTGYYIYFVKNKEMQDYLIDVRQEQEAAISYEKMLAQKRDERIIRQSRRKLENKNKKGEHILQKTAAAAVAMFFLGATGTYLLFGQTGLPQTAIETFSDKIKQTSNGEKVKNDKGSVSAVFTTETSTKNETGNSATASTGEKKKETVNQSDNNLQTYTVQKGDTITKISIALFQSKKYVDEIMEANGLAESESIYPGQKLRIPAIK